MPETTSKPWPLVREGAKDDMVKPLQHLLNDRGEDDEDRRVTVDGIFGAETEAAVKAFQEAGKLQVDGIVGPKTWDKLHRPGPQGKRGRLGACGPAGPRSRARTSMSTASSGPRRTQRCGASRRRWA